MGSALLIAADHGWYIGLLVILIVLALLFVFIALATLKPYKIDDDGGDELALRLLDDKEASLITELLHKPGDEAVLNRLREVATAKIIIKELLAEANGAEPEKPFAPTADLQLTAAEVKSLESEGAVSIEQTFALQPAAAENNGVEKSFTAKLMQANDSVKVWYFELKNCILCYEKTKVNVRWNNEKFYIGRTNVATLTMRGKQLCLYLAVNAEEYTDQFPVKASTSEMYNHLTPCLFRIKSAKHVKQAKELIALMMSDYGVMYLKTNHSIYALPYEDDDALVAKGLAKKTGENTDKTTDKKAAKKTKTKQPVNG